MQNTFKRLAEKVFTRVNTKSFFFFLGILTATAFMYVPRAYMVNRIKSIVLESHKTLSIANHYTVLQCLNRNEIAELRTFTAHQLEEELLFFADYLGNSVPSPTDTIILRKVKTMLKQHPISYQSESNKRIIENLLAKIQ